jgi:hypothetical protein
MPLHEADMVAQDGAAPDAGVNRDSLETTIHLFEMDVVQEHRPPWANRPTTVSNWDKTNASVWIASIRAMSIFSPS